VSKNRPRPVDVVGLNAGVTQVTAGGEHSCALLVDGSSRCWGEAGNGQFARVVNPDVPQRVPLVAGFPSGLVSLHAGTFHTCMRTRAGAALCVGNNGASELGYGRRHSSSLVALPVPGLEQGVTALDTHGGRSCAAIRAASVSCWGAGFGQDDPPRPRRVQVSGAIRAVAAGGSGCALINPNRVECWTTALEGREVAGLGKPVTAITAGGGHQCAVVDGNAKCWGRNEYGQLGDGSTRDRAAPVSVRPPG
jgi:alpha-tubulin suppressor-like RCC1 family protein